MKMKWISVKDKLPDENVWVLLYDKKSIVIGRLYFSIMKWEILNHSTTNEIIFKKDRVSFWMPLPEKPE
jgi:hypothetical protein